MRTRVASAAFAAFVAATISSGGARAADTDATDTDAGAYCEWVSGAADAESAVLVAPSLFGTFGVINGPDALLSNGGAGSQAPLARIVAGASYSVSDLYRGLTMRAGAEAECARYKTVSDLHAFLENNKDAQSRRGLKSKLDVLVAALPQGEAVVRALRESLQAGHATVEEVDAAALRLDGLRELAAETRRELDALARMPPVPLVPVTSLLAARDRTEERAESYEARLRESRGWDLSVRGGYDRLFGVRDYLPLFVSGTLTVSLGWFFQYGADARALRARHAWVRRQVEGVDDRVEQALARLRAVRAAEEVRLKETTVLLADLEARYGAVSSVAGEKAKAYAQYIWFDLIRTRAEHQYLTAHVSELAVLLRDVPR